MFSRRMEGVKESATIKMAALARALRKEGEKVLDFSLGEPDFSTPPHICEAAKRAMDAGFTHYVPSAGIPELREEIAIKIREENRVDVSAENVIVTPGAKQAIFAAMMSILNEGDEVIMLEPAWVSFEAAIRMAGGKPIWLLRRDKPVNYDMMSSVVSEKTRMIVINSPNNPVGYVMEERELREIAEFASDHNVLVMSDEIYEKIIYEKKHVSIASLDAMSERTIIINGFSKTYAMTGWRVGYAVAPVEIVNTMLKIQQHSVTCASSISQYAALEALRSSQECVYEMVSEFKRRRDLIVRRLRDIGFACEMPDGAFYVFAGIPTLSTSSASSSTSSSSTSSSASSSASSSSTSSSASSPNSQNEQKDDVAFAEMLLRDTHIVVTPGSAFGNAGRNYVRFSYAASIEEISEGMARIEKLISSH